MKLLKKTELNVKLQEQNSNEVKAGLFLAKKVDALREELQEVIANNSKVMEGMKRDYELFMAEQTSKRGAIVKEIEGLTQQRASLRIPLDAEWQEVRLEKEELVKLSESLLLRENLLKENETFITNKNLELSNREEGIQERESRTKQSLLDAQRKESQTQELLEGIKIYETETKQSIQVRLEEVAKRETDIAYREVDVQNRNKHALAKEEANRKETLRIESKQRQIKNVLEELKKNVTNNNPNTER